MPLDKLRLGACFVVYGSHGHAQVHSYRTGPDLNISYGCVCSRRCGRSRKAWRWCSVKALSRVRITRSIPYAPRIKYDCHIVSCQSGPSAQMNVEQQALQHFAHEVLPGEYCKVKRKHCTLKRSKLKLGFFNVCLAGVNTKRKASAPALQCPRYAWHHLTAE